MWKDLKEATGRLSISIDASGSFVKPVNTSNGKSVHVFLYTAVTGHSEKIIPLWQMLSEKHDKNTLKYALRAPIDDGAPIPDEVTSDMALAILNAASWAFNRCTYKEFSLSCLNFKLKKSNELNTFSRLMNFFFRSQGK